MIKKSVYQLSKLAVVLGLFLISATKAQCQYNISTIAGNGTNGYSGDGGAATAASVGYVLAIAVDGSGNILIADGENNCIRKITPAGIISTFAGNGTPGYSGDGSAATAATLNNPQNVAVDGSGNVYIADYNNYVIRKVTPSGVISTFAGNGTLGNAGDGGPATDAEFIAPQGVAADASGNIYIVDPQDSRVRKVSTSGIINTIAGNGSRGYSGDGGPATDAELYNAQAVATDATGNVYIADEANDVIRKVTISGIISTVAGNNTGGYSGDGGAATDAQLSGPNGVFVDGGGNILIADADYDVIRKVNPSGIISTIAGDGTYGFSGDGGAATAAQLGNAYDVAADGSGNVYIADTYSNRVRKLTPGTGCSSPTVSAITGTATVCQGTNVYLSNATTGGHWSTSAPSIATASATGTIHGASAGSVTVSYTVTNSCGSTSVTFPMTVNPAAVSGSISGPSSMCTGTAAAFSTTGAVGGTWSTSNTSVATINASGNLSALATGTATVSYVVSNTCGTQTSTKPFSVIAAPSSVAAITGAVNVGVGSAITLYETTPGGVWSSSDTTICKTTSAGSVNGISVGNATISYTISNMCGSITATKSINSSKLYFLAGATQTINMCKNSGSTNLNLSLKAYEQTAGRTLRWSLLTVPHHGTAAATYTSTSVVGANTPATTSFAPIGTYVGLDSFTVRVTDSISSDTEKVYINMHDLDPLPTISGPNSVCIGSSISLTGSPSGGVWSSNGSSAITFTSGGSVTGVTGSSAPVIYYSITSVWSCISTSAYPVTVNAPGVIGGIAGTVSNVCPGSSILVRHLTPGGTWGISDLTKATIAAIATGSDTANVTGISSGKDTVLYTLTNACGSLTARWPVTVPSSTPVTISGATTPMCIGSSTLFTDGTTGGTWSTSNASVASVSSTGSVAAIGAGTASISYAITVCGITGYASKNVTVNPTPHAGTISGPSTVIIAHNISLGVSGSSGAGTWSSSNNGIATVNATGSIVHGVGAGVDTIKFTVANSCGSSVAIYPVTVTLTRSENGNGSVTSNEENSSIKLYPNPTTGMVTLEVERNVGMTTMIISDLSGKTVITRETEANQLSVDMSQLPAGMYLVKVNTGGKTYFEKLIVR